MIESLSPLTTSQATFFFFSFSEIHVAEIFQCLIELYVYLTGVERLAGVSLHKPIFLDVTVEDREEDGKVDNDTKVYTL